MRKILYLFAFLLACSFTAQAQLKVASSGQVGIKETSPQGDLHVKDNGNVANIIVQREDQNNYVNLLSGSTGNSFYYARAKRFSVVPSGSITSTSPNVPNSLFFYGPDWGTPANAGNAGFGTDAPVEKLDVDGNVRADAFIVASDRRLKTDIKSYEYGLKEALQVNPVSFKYNNRVSENTEETHIGVVAQELQQIAPELVEEFTHVIYEYDEDGTQRYVGEETYLQVRDSEVKWMLFNAVKAQQEELDAKDAELKDLAAQVAELKEMVQTLAGQPTSNTTTSEKLDVKLEGTSQVALGQNIPNPFTTETTIEYTVEDDFTTAEMRIFDMNGRLMHTEPITQSGAGVVNIQTANMQSGTYSYSLVVDGKVLGTKSMIMAK